MKVLSPQLLSNLTNFLPDTIQFQISFIQNVLSIWYASFKRNPTEQHKHKVQNYI